MNNPLKYTDPSGYYSNGYQYENWAVMVTDGGGGGGGYFMNSQVNGYQNIAGNHWAVAYRSVYSNFMLMGSSTFQHHYGISNSDYDSKIIPNYQYLPQYNQTFQQNSSRQMGFYGSEFGLGNVVNNGNIKNAGKPHDGGGIGIKFITLGDQGGGDGLWGDVLGLVDKHFNGGLGYIGVAVNAYNKIPNDFKRHYAHEISKKTGWKSGKIFQNTKGFVNGSGKLVSRLGTTGSILSGAVITYDLLDDGNLRSSSIINGALLGVGLAFPVTAPFIIGYGILDYSFGISDQIDNHFGTVKTGIYD